MSKGEFDVALGARVISKEAGGRIQVNGLFLVKMITLMVMMIICLER